MDKYAYLESVYHNVCVMCLHLANDPHHVIALSAGGEDAPRNVVPLCRSCHTEVTENGWRKYVETLFRRAEMIRRFYQTEELYENGPQYWAD